MVISRNYSQHRGTFVIKFYYGKPFLNRYQAHTGWSRNRKFHILLKKPSFHFFNFSTFTSCFHLFLCCSCRERYSSSSLLAICRLPSLDTVGTVLVGRKSRTTGRPADIGNSLALLVDAPHLPDAVAIAGRVLARFVWAVILTPHREAATRGFVAAGVCNEGVWEEKEAEQQEGKRTHLQMLC